MASNRMLPWRPALPSIALAAVAVLGGACAAGVSGVRAPADSAPGPAVQMAAPSEELLQAHAELIRLEDRRDFDIPTLRRISGNPAAAVRARAALALGRLRQPEGADLLLSLLADGDTAVAATAAFALGQLGDSVHAPALAAALADAFGSAPTVAAEAAYALGKVGGETALGALAETLGREAPAGVRALAVESALLAIWKLRPLQDLELVTRWLESPDPELRWRAAYTLVRRPDHRALASLRTALADEDPRVRAQAARGLTAAAADSAGVARAAVLRDLLPLVQDPVYEIAINAIRALGSYSEPEVVSTLVSASAGSRRHVALAAIESLGRIGAEAREAAPALAAFASGDSLPLALRIAALDALARIDVEVAAEEARRFALSPAWRIRAAAARAYGIMAGPASPDLRELLNDADPRVAGAALQAAIDGADDDLLSIRPLLIEQLGARDAVVRSTALTALARQPAPELLPLFLDAYGRARGDTINDAALAAVDAIGAIAAGGLTPTRAFLARFARSDDSLVRLRAVQRLDSAAVVRTWGPPLPQETGRSISDYRALVDRLVAPGLEGAADPEVLLVTHSDTIRLRLFAADAPLTAENLLSLAEEGYFDGQEWPRVVPNFVVQGGDPRGDTSGGPGYSIRDEISRRRYDAGTLGMALAGPDTGGSQFFITHSPQPHLDGTYAVFGEVAAGAEVAEDLLPGDIIEFIRSAR